MANARATITDYLSRLDGPEPPGANGAGIVVHPDQLDLFEPGTAAQIKRGPLAVLLESELNRG